MLARDVGNDYVLYAQNGLPTDQIPTSANAVVRLLAPDPAHGEKTLTQAMERLTTTNPDGLDVLLLLSPLEMAPGYDLPAKPLNGLKIGRVHPRSISDALSGGVFLPPAWARSHRPLLQGFAPPAVLRLRAYRLGVDPA